MRSFLRSAFLAGSVLSLSFVLVGCEDASKTPPPATPEVKDGMAPSTKKDAMEPEVKKDGMEPKMEPKVETPAPVDAPK